MNNNLSTMGNLDFYTIKGQILTMVKKSDDLIRNSTIDNLTHLCIALGDYSENFAYRFKDDENEVRVMHEELADRIGISKTRIAELMIVAKDLGILTIKCVDKCCWRIARNVYTLISRKLFKNIRVMLRRQKTFERDDRSAIIDEMLIVRSDYESLGCNEKVLNMAEKAMLEKCNTVKGVRKYYYGCVATALQEHIKISKISFISNNPNYKNGENTTSSYLENTLRMVEENDCL